MFEDGDVVEIVGEPCLKSASHKTFADGIVLDESTCQHDSSGENCSEANAHLVEDDACEDEEEDKDVEEGFRALHGTERRGVPTTLGEHEVLDGRKDVHEDVGTEHCQCQQE